MADQGASQRRGTESAVSLISQANTTTPPESYTTSGFSSNLGPVGGNDTASIEERPHEVGITPIGGSTTVTGNSGTYTPSLLGTVSVPDYGGQIVRPKETGISLLGQTTPETGSHGTSYTTVILGQQTPIGGGGGTTVTTYYKLRARDTGASYVEWVTTVTPLSVGSYPGTPVGSLVELTVLSIVTR